MFSLGLGSGASQDLIKKSAEAGRGSYEILLDGSILSEKVMVLLQKALSTNEFCYFELLWDN